MPSLVPRVDGPMTLFNMVPIRLTAHAKMRWLQRCKGMDLETEWRMAYRPGKSARKTIRKKLPITARMLRPHDGNRCRPMLSTNGVLFVVARDDDSIVTVYNLNTMGYM